ncbi:siderophore-interacting protein [Hymenobacter sp. BT664]|uniref:Siderophore-interacting protein n=1 Tax=Hymenobacter montanus TaxID=2771359 RepID=A0A927BFU5_9BACT|nr:siderophore-interacting protein [Hymenobacter montanus]MBD2769399.1 siderophore-interacting protein [Hymenobacter montanus]
MSIFTSLARQVTQQATVRRAERIATHTYRITLTGPALEHWAYIPGQTLNVFFGLAAAGDAANLRKRTYSVWGHDAGRHELELAVCTFSDGPGAQWAAQCRPGDAVHFYGPGGKFLLDPAAPAHVFLGDVSCLAHFYALRRQLPPAVPCISVIHARHRNDVFADLDGGLPLRVEVVDSFSAAQYLQAAEAQGLRRLAGAHVYWGGPAATCAAGYRLLRHAWQWPTARIKAKPFWK